MSECDNGIQVDEYPENTENVVENHNRKNRFVENHTQDYFVENVLENHNRLIAHIRLFLIILVGLKHCFN